MILPLTMAAMLLVAPRIQVDDPEVHPPVTQDDVRILVRAQQILNSPAKWNRNDNRNCPAEEKQFSLYCAVEKATDEVTGQFAHREAAMQEARFVVDEIAANRPNYHHRLMDYNNDPTTTFADIQRVLKTAEANVEKKLAAQKAGAAKKTPQ
jgi:hypothetical protein